MSVVAVMGFGLAVAQPGRTWNGTADGKGRITMSSDGDFNIERVRLDLRRNGTFVMTVNGDIRREEQSFEGRWTSRRDGEAQLDFTRWERRGADGDGTVRFTRGRLDSLNASGRAGRDRFSIRFDEQARRDDRDRGGIGGLVDDLFGGIFGDRDRDRDRNRDQDRNRRDDGRYDDDWYDRDNRNGSLPNGFERGEGEIRIDRREYFIRGIQIDLNGVNRFVIRTDRDEFRGTYKRRDKRIQLTVTSGMRDGRLSGSGSIQFLEDGRLNYVEMNGWTGRTERWHFAFRPQWRLDNARGNRRGGGGFRIDR